MVDVNKQIKNLSSSDDVDRLNAVGALSHAFYQGMDISRAVPALINALADGDSRIHGNAGRILELMENERGMIFKEIFVGGKTQRIKELKGNDRDLLLGLAIRSFMNDHVYCYSIVYECFGKDFREKMAEIVRKERNPVEKVRLREKLSFLYAEFIPKIGRPRELEDLKTLKLPERRKGKFRMRRVRNG